MVREQLPGGLDQPLACHTVLGNRLCRHHSDRLNSIVAAVMATAEKAVR